MAVDSTSNGGNVQGAILLGGLGTWAVAGGTSAMLRGAHDTARFDEALVRSVVRPAAEATDVDQLVAPLAKARSGTLEQRAGSVMGEWKVTTFGTASKRAVNLFDHVAGQQTIEGARTAISSGVDAAAHRADRLGTIRGGAKALAWLGGMAAIGALMYPSEGPRTVEVSANPSADDF